MCISINLNEKFWSTNMEHRDFSEAPPDMWYVDRCYYQYEYSSYEWWWQALVLYDWKRWVWNMWHCSCYWPRDQYNSKDICTKSFKEALEATWRDDDVKDFIKRDWL